MTMLTVALGFAVAAVLAGLAVATAVAVRRRRAPASSPSPSSALGPEEIRDRLMARIAVETRCILLALRADELLVLEADRAAPQTPLLGGAAPSVVLDALRSGAIRSVKVRRLEADGRIGPLADRPELLAFATGYPEAVQALLGALESSAPPPSSPMPYFDRLGWLVREPELIDFAYHGYMAHRAAMGSPDSRPPFNAPDTLSRSVPAQPRRRSVVFLHSNYYTYENMAVALRKRGWDAVSVSLTAPDGADRWLLHGEDINLFDADPAAMVRKTAEFVKAIPERFQSVHFYGRSSPSFFHANCEDSPDPTTLPWDFLELRRHRLIIGNTPSGCMDGPRPSFINQAAQGVCDRCVWQLRPDVCGDAVNSAWQRKLEAFCDWVGLEGDFAVDGRTGPKFVQGPVVTALDPARWRPDLEPPEAMRIERAPGEVLIYHAVANYHLRRAGDRDIKGTGAVMAAIDRLKADGLPVQLVFATDIPSTEVRFLQVQADIVVDQLNYGRNGANARESFMLGRPVVTRVTPTQGAPLSPLPYIAESPAARADEATVYEVLKSLVLDPERRARMGEASRQYALKWHDRDRCAERFERVIDRVNAGLRPDDPSIYA